MKTKRIHAGQNPDNQMTHSVRLNFDPFNLPINVLNERHSTHYYRPPTKLWECNVFTHVCLFIRGGSLCNHYPWCIGPHCTTPSQPSQAPPPKISHHQIWDPLASPPTGDIWWPSLETCSNVFIWGRPQPTSTDIWLYGWHVGGTHPIVMLSDLKIKF